MSDVDQTEAFYRDVLGLDIQRLEDDGSGNDWLMGTTTNEISLVFMKGEARPGNTPVIVFEIPDGGIDDAISELSEKGVTIVTPVSHAPGGGRPTLLILMRIISPCTNLMRSHDRTNNIGQNSKWNWSKQPL